MKLRISALLVTLLLVGCGSKEPAKTGEVAGTPKQVTAGQTAGGAIHPPGWGQPPPAKLQLTAAPSVTAVMFDSITLSTVPSSPFALAGYTSGYWPTYLPMRRTWPTAHTVSIAISTAYHADCLDVEPGDATPGQVPGWVRADKAAGFVKPCVYSSYYMFIEQVRPALRRAGIPRSATFDWDASYTYHPHIDAGFDATQWTDAALGRNLDQSAVLHAFLTIAQPPYTPSHPKPKPHPNPHVNAAKIALLRSYARRRGCYSSTARKPHACAVWAREVRALGG